MFRSLLKLGLQRMIVTIIFQCIMIIRCSNSLGVLVGQTVYVVMYVIVAFTLCLIEIALLEGKIKPLAKYHKVWLIIISIITVLIGLGADIFEYNAQQHILKNGQVQCCLGYADVILIPLLFEGVFKIVIGLKKAE